MASLDTSYLSEYGRQILSEDILYLPEVTSNQRPTVFFRPGNRISPVHPAYWKSNEEGVSYIRFIKVYGSHKQQVPPTYFPEQVCVRIIARYTKAISAITIEECKKAYSELIDPETIRTWLQQKYPGCALSIDSSITVYAIEYLSSGEGYG